MNAEHEKNALKGKNTENNKQQYMGKIKYYISGKITGLQPSEYAAMFGKAEERLTAQGFDVVNPLRHVVPSAHWKEQMKVDIRMLLDCNAIYML